MNTQHIIFEATVDLMKKKAIKSITMAGIAKASNVSRGQFICTLMINIVY